MESLKSAGETAVNSATGTLLFIWSKVSNVIAKRLDFTYKLEASGKLKSAVHSGTRSMRTPTPGRNTRSPGGYTYM